MRRQTGTPDDASEAHRLLTAPQTADLFQVHERTVKRWAEAGVLPFVRIAGTLRFERSAVDALIESHTVRSKAS